MNLIEHLISDRFIYAIGWTIAHSIWQIMLISIILWGILYLLRKSSSNLRYLFTASSFVMIIITVITTFITLYNNFLLEAPISGEQDGGILQTMINETGINEGFTYISVMYFFIEIFEQISIRIGNNLSFIVLLWFVGLVVFSIKLTGNVIYVQHLKRFGLQPISSDLQDTLKILSNKIGVRKSILIAESLVAKVPMVVGYLKPVILLPAGLICSTPPDQIEAILAHELAHIRRKDVLINTLKSIIEVIFFYHPAIWWMSFVFDQEREHCCDDITLHASINPIALSKALLGAEEYRIKSPKLVAAFKGNNNKLFNRIKRMNTKKTNTRKFNGRALALTIVFCGMIVLIVNSTVFESPGTVNLENSESSFVPSPVGQPSMNAFEDVNDDKNSDLNNPDKEEERMALKKKLQKLFNFSQKTKDKLLIIKSKISKGKGEPSEKKIDFLKVNLKKHEEATKYLTMVKESIFADKQSKDISEEKMKKSQKLLDESSFILQEINNNISKFYGNKSPEYASENEKKKREKIKIREKTKITDPEILQKKTKQVFWKKLVDEGIIKEDSKNSFSLTKQKFVVNGKKQSKEIHEKFLKIYHKINGHALKEGKTFELNK
jgi:beta-lactamase regulating signal transducer with metallopeptidase domain